MIYPKFIKKQDTIGITAPSDGITASEKIVRLNSAINQLTEYGFQLYETKNVRQSEQGKSSTSQEQAKQLSELLADKTVKAIICAAGGDFLLETLPYIDFDQIKQNPKWIQGFSDPTGLLYTITTNLDIATIYGDNIGSFGMIPWHESLYNNLKLLQGEQLIQNSFLKYQKEYQTYITGTEPYHLTENVYWKNLKNESNLEITGRIIGGCLDVLNDLFGTRFDKTKEFIERYQTDGIIWYFDVCEFTSEQLIRTLWKWKDNDYFKHTQGIIFGRIPKEHSYYDITLEQAILHSLGDLNIPIIINTDIGHVSPRMTIINGSIATITLKEGKGTITFELT